MQEHRVYTGTLKTVHYFVEVKKGLFDEWNIENVRDITHKDIVKWRLRERERKARAILTTIGYIKRGCGETLRLIKTVYRGGGVTYNSNFSLHF